MRRMPEALINDVRAKSDIVDTISNYMTLTKKGKNYWGVCPFHNDHDPSMSVSPDRQIYKCFVCGAGGNVFSFVENFEKVSFIEAVIKTASRVNIDLSEYESTTTAPVNEEKKRLLEALDETQKFTEFQLFTKDGQEAMVKLEERGYNQELIRKFGIGVAFGNNQITNFLIAKGFSEEELIRADLSRMSDDGLRDVFYNRIMFPIFDPYGHPIGFSARALSDSNSVKYINTSETETYVKGNTVYNFHNAKDASRKEGYVLVTEGVTDAIAFTKVGINNVVSMLGVACTPQQIRLLKQCSSNIVLAFDGDRAGLEATFNIGKKLRQEQCTVSIWYNDSGLDPDDAVRKLGEDVVKKGIEDRTNWLDFVMSYAIGNYGLESFDKRKRVVEFMIDYLRTEDELTQSYYLKKLAEKTNFDVGVLSQQLQNKVTTEIPRANPGKLVIETSNHFDVILPERAILKQMLGSKEAAHIYRDQLGFLVSDLATDFAMVILDRYRVQETIQIADILSLDIHDKMRQFALEIDSSEIMGEFDRMSLQQNIDLVRRELLRLGIGSLKDEGRRKMEIDEQSRLLEEAIKQIRSNKREGER
ncbi:DNA primase [Erysipelothrix sp. HDW6C]|uniref:DNA primase n=1 Tax=Erysipelothrix sp. HDW6C TaxID=2714930 RepID=UPI0014073A85|nr:DNA primase [Erysipelothrix sp. HDW6C]QIK70163.1 DNA primase [Erysipelothrix sp. HDW6C]